MYMSVCRSLCIYTWAIRKVKKNGISDKDILHFYYFKLRSVLEANCVIYHPMLTQEEANDIERIQKIVLRIILAHKYKNYTQACLLMNIETLQSRRINLSLNFGLKCIIVINTLTYSNSTTKFL